MTVYYKKFKTIIKQVKANGSINIVQNRSKALKLSSSDEGKRIYQDRLIENNENVLLQNFEEYYNFPSLVKLCWEYDVNGETKLGGEIHFTHPFIAATDERKLFVGSFLPDLPESTIRAEKMKLFDAHSYTGDGHVGAFRQTQQGEIEIYYHAKYNMYFSEPSTPFALMNLNFETYLDALLLTKGFLNWQYLFCETISNKQKENVIEKYLNPMFEILPQLFPNEDYTFLTEQYKRFKASLG